MKTFLSEKIIFKEGLIILLPLISLLLTGCDSAEKRQFMTGCKIATRNGSACACAWEKMSAIYPTKLLKAIGEQKVAAPFGFQNDMTNSLQQCIREE